MECIRAHGASHDLFSDISDFLSATGEPGSWIKGGVCLPRLLALDFLYDIIRCDGDDDDNDSDSDLDEDDEDEHDDNDD